jgi:hypothetical protein
MAIRVYSDKMIAGLIASSFWAGILAGVVAVLFAVLICHQFLGLEYSFPSVTDDSAASECDDPAPDEAPSRLTRYSP